MGELPKYCMLLQHLFNVREKTMEKAVKLWELKKDFRYQ